MFRVLFGRPSSSNSTLPRLQSSVAGQFLDALPPSQYVAASKTQTELRGPVATELGGSQITSLMEVLPGIAQVLRSPVADAIVSLIRTASKAPQFELHAADEILKFAVRRNLMATEESERVLAEARAVVAKRAERAAEREKPKKPVVASRPKPKAKAHSKPQKKPKAAPKAA